MFLERTICHSYCPPSSYLAAKALKNKSVPKTIISMSSALWKLKKNQFRSTIAVKIYNTMWFMQSLYLISKITKKNIYNHNYVITRIQLIDVGSYFIDTFVIALRYIISYIVIPFVHGT